MSAPESTAAPVTGAADTPAAPDELRPALEELRAAISQMFGAERRLRGREHAPGELTHAHIRSLHALGAQGEMTAGQLARSADLNPASVTAMLDHLEEAGIVARSRSATDRRLCLVSLTPQGRELLAAKSAGWRALWQERLETFDDDELEAAGRVMRELAALFDSVTVAKERAARGD